jgi:hypothetical protein
MRLRSVLPTGAVLIAAFLLASCKQKEGDRCNLESDCEGGLTCCVLPAKRAEGGKCLPMSKCDLAATDSGPTDAKTEGRTDAKPPLDVNQLPLDLKLVPDLKAAPDLKPTPDLKPAPDSKPSSDTKPGDLSIVH